MTPLIEGIKRGTVVPPRSGWKERKYYLVDVAYSGGNVIHRSIFYSGFLTDGKPGGYNILLSPFSDNDSSLRDVFYLKVVRILPFTLDSERAK